MGARDLRRHPQRILRPDRMQPGGRQLRRPDGGQARFHGARRARTPRRDHRRKGRRDGRRRPRQDRRRAPRPRHVPEILERRGSDAPEVHRRLAGYRRPGLQGRRRISVVPGTRRRRHHVGRLSHRTRRDRGLPGQAPGGVDGGRRRCSRQTAHRGRQGVHRVAARRGRRRGPGKRYPRLRQDPAVTSRIPAPDRIRRNPSHDGDRKNPAPRSEK